MLHVREIYGFYKISNNLEMAKQATIQQSEVMEAFIEAFKIKVFNPANSNSVGYVLALLRLQVPELSHRDRASCRVGKFWPKYKWKTTMCTKRCRCQKN